MRKKSALIYTMLLCSLLVAVPLSAQIVSVSTAHWSFDKDINIDSWLETETKFHENVTMKNEHIKGANVLYHYYTADNSEILFVSVYENLAAIDKAQERNKELIEAAWPDEDERKAFFKKQSQAYSTMHSDEIYSSVPESKTLESMPDTSMIYYVRKSRIARMPEDGSMDEIQDAMKTFREKVIFKNDVIKAYYPMRHFYGADSRDFIEVFVVNSLSDLEKMAEMNDKLIKKNWPKEDKRKAFFDMVGKYFEPWHGDFIYTSEPKLMKMTKAEK
ncbi:hypothetical protein [Marinoscillum sp. MHG1-6]|uniref:hypothetical protein n=1 Tax=Marinoscillum sp. MHG1-6 TaxID=2959627 RepID=UPI002157C885|nr:hypothetical protein [Marinoscillum sp. MHG1-6]